jgi:hypothetical protein
MKNEQYASKANKGCNVIFEPRDCVYVHIRKKRFPPHMRSKLQFRGNNPFKILERVKNDAYKLYLLGEYNVNAIFNVFFISFSFYVGN